MFTFALWCLLTGLSSKVSADIEVSGGWLYWKTKQAGLDYTNKPQSVFTTTNFADSALVAPDFDWSSGFRLAADCTRDDCEWSGGVHLIHYHGSAHGSRTAGPNDGIFPTLSFSNATLPNDYVTSASTSWSLHTTLVDFVAACEWCMNDCLTVTPSLAVRNVWISQHLTARYLGATFSAGADDVDLRSSFYGVGPRLGITPRYLLGNGFSIYGEAAAALLYGQFHVSQQETFLGASQGALNRNPHGARWNADVAVGVSWEQCAEGLAPGCAFTADLGFDLLYFSKQYEFRHGPQFSLRSQNSYLLLYGMHLSAGLRF